MTMVTVNFPLGNGDTISVDLDVFVDGDKCHLEEVLENEDMAGLLYCRHGQELTDLADAQLTKVQEERKISKYGKKLMNQAYENIKFRHGG